MMQGKVAEILQLHITSSLALFIFEIPGFNINLESTDCLKVCSCFAANLIVNLDSSIFLF